MNELTLWLPVVALVIAAHAAPLRDCYVMSYLTPDVLAFGILARLVVAWWQREERQRESRRHQPGRGQSWRRVAVVLAVFGIVGVYGLLRIPPRPSQASRTPAQAANLQRALAAGQAHHAAMQARRRWPARHKEEALAE